MEPSDVGSATGLGARLKAWREARGLSQDALADALGVTGASVSGWERETSEPREAQVVRLAAYFGRTPAELRYGALAAGGDASMYRAGWDALAQAVSAFIAQARPEGEGGEQSPAPEPPVPVAPPQRPFKEVSRHAKAPLHPIKKPDQDKGRRKA